MEDSASFSLNDYVIIVVYNDNIQIIVSKKPIMTLHTIYIFLCSQCSCSTQGSDQKQDPCHRENGQNVLSSQVGFLKLY